MQYNNIIRGQKLAIFMLKIERLQHHSGRPCSTRSILFDLFMKHIYIGGYKLFYNFMGSYVQRIKCIIYSIYPYYGAKDFIAGVQKVNQWMNGLTSPYEQKNFNSPFCFCKVGHNATR